jgi:hypothetical protein
MLLTHPQYITIRKQNLLKIKIKACFFSNWHKHYVMVYPVRGIMKHYCSIANATPPFINTYILQAGIYVLNLYILCFP